MPGFSITRMRSTSRRSEVANPCESRRRAFEPVCTSAMIAASVLVCIFIPRSTPLSASAGSTNHDCGDVVESVLGTAHDYTVSGHLVTRDVVCRHARRVLRRFLRITNGGLGRAEHVRGFTCRGRTRAPGSLVVNCRRETSASVHFEGLRRTPKV